jgi:putative sterol carrier protein
MATREELVAALTAKAKTAVPLGKTVKFDLGADGQIFIDGRQVSTEGTTADTTITISAANLEKLVAGDLNPTLAFMTGKLKVAGDMGTAMKLSSLLED